MRYIHNLLRSVRDVQNVSLLGTYIGGRKSKVTQVLVRRHFIVPLYYIMVKVYIVLFFNITTLSIKAFVSLCSERLDQT